MNPKPALIAAILVLNSWFAPDYLAHVPDSQSSFEPRYRVNDHEWEESALTPTDGGIRE